MSLAELARIPLSGLSSDVTDSGRDFPTRGVTCDMCDPLNESDRVLQLGLQPRGERSPADHS